MNRDIIKEVQNFIKLSPKTTVREACLLLGIPLEDYQKEFQKRIDDGNGLLKEIFGRFN
jgi:hypothetical protein